jgi:hypothetical protein
LPVERAFIDADALLIDKKALIAALIAFAILPG